MKNLKLILFLFIGIIITNCTNDKLKEYFEFEGVWKGIYDGDDDNGLWEVAINSEGEIIGNAISNILNVSYDMSGQVQQNGDLSLVSGSSGLGDAFLGIIFEGRLNNDEASGTWKNTVTLINGSWTGNKE